MFAVVVDATTQALIAAVIAVVVPITVAVLGATWLETRRQHAINEMKKKTLRDALYAEIAWMCIELNAARKYMTSHSAESTRNASFVTATPSHYLYLVKEALRCKDVYQSTREDPTIFYQLPDAVGIEFFYRTISNMIPRLEAFWKHSNFTLDVKKEDTVSDSDAKERADEADKKLDTKTVESIALTFLIATVTASETLALGGLNEEKIGDVMSKFNELDKAPMANTAMVAADKVIEDAAGKVTGNVKEEKGREFSTEVDHK